MSNAAFFAAVTPFQQAPQSADIALTEFATDFMTAWMGTPPAWASDPTSGYLRPTDALALRTVIPYSAEYFDSYAGAFRWRSLGLAHVSHRQQEWKDAVKDLASNVEAGDYAGFNQQPGIMAENGRWTPNLWIATQLDEGESIASWDSPDWSPDTFDTANGVFGTGSIPFFSEEHITNPFGGQVVNNGPATWSNVIKAQLGLESFRAAKTLLRKVPKPNGQNFGVQPTKLRVHPDQAEIGRGILEKDLILDEGVQQSNIEKGIVKLEVSTELLTPGDWYLEGCNKRLVRPWVTAMARGGIPEMFIHNKDSELYKGGGLEVGFGAVLRGSLRLLWPHAIVKGIGS